MQRSSNASEKQFEPLVMDWPWSKKNFLTPKNLTERNFNLDWFGSQQANPTRSV